MSSYPKLNSVIKDNKNKSFRFSDQSKLIK